MRTLILVLILSVTLSAETQPSAWPIEQRSKANTISWITASSNVAGDLLHGWKSQNRKKALTCLAFRYGISSLAVHTTKLLIHRERPDGSDNQSFYSGHTSTAFVAYGWNYSISIPLAIGTGYMRAAANKHYWSDIAVGAGAGFLSTKVCKVE